MTATAPYCISTPQRAQTHLDGANSLRRKRRVTLRLLFVCLLIAPLLALAEDENRNCNESILKGDYGLIVTGNRNAGTVIENFVTLSLVTFDGKGGFTATGVSHGATTGIRKGPVSGTYTVNANCTGAWTTNIQGVPPIPAEIVIVDRGREIFVSSVSASEVSSGRLRQK